MSSTIGHNSMVMATGTAASRITGQVRTILLAAAVGTTGLAANAYQAGSQIPQVIYTLISGGIFNAVLVPQIVRTLKSKNAEEQLNKLITFAIVLLLAVTGIVAALAPALTRLYVNGGNDMLALSTAFTFWCVPQIFFYGLYTVIGQILAAKEHFGVYAWSSVGANVISCIGFTAFILLFGKADKQPLGFWTNDKIALTAGAWTLGVAFQALVLFLPLFKIGVHYRPKFGIHGIGLKQMGPVAAWSLGIVAVDQIATIVNTRISTSAPLKAHEAYGTSLYDVAGNATYQNAFTIYILPYSLIAVSVATAIFPRIAQFVADHDIDSARSALSQSLCNVWLIMCFFTAVFVCLPAPISLTLLPSISVKEALLMSGPLIGLALGLPLCSVYLIIQRTFYAFEDGFHPFIFMALQSVIQVAILLVGSLLIREDNWVALLGISITLGYVFSFPALVIMLRKRFEGRIDGAKLSLTFAKGAIAAIVSTVLGLLLRYPVYSLFGAYLQGTSGHMNWFQAVGVCAVLGVLVTLVYAGALWALRTPEFVAFVQSGTQRVRKMLGKGEIAQNTTENTAQSVEAPMKGEKRNAATSKPDTSDAASRQARRVVSGEHQYTPRIVRSSISDTGSFMPPSFVASSLAQSSIWNDAEQDSLKHRASVQNGTESSPAQYGGAQSSTPKPPATHVNGAGAHVPSENNGETHMDLPPIPSYETHIDSATPNVRINHTSIQPTTKSPSRTESAMKPKSNDVVINRYKLVSPLRQADGLEAWRVNDIVLDREQQLFIITNMSVAATVEAIASSLALSVTNRFTKVHSLQHVQNTPVLVTQLDPDLSLDNCLGLTAAQTPLDFETMRLIASQVAEGLKQLLSDGISLPTLTTGMVRIDTKGVQIADAPVTPLFVDLLKTPKMDAERTAVYQVSALLYAMLVDKKTADIKDFDLTALPENTPEEFQLICQRGLDPAYLNNSSTIAMVSLSELMSLLSSATEAQRRTSSLNLYNAVARLNKVDLGVSTSHDATIEHAVLQPVTTDAIAELSDELINGNATADGAAGAPDGSEETDSNGNAAESANPDEAEPSTPGTDDQSNSAAAHATARTFKSILSGHSTANGNNDKALEAFSPSPYPADATSQDAGDTGVHLDFHDIAAAEVAQAFKPVDAFADNSLFPDYTNNQHTDHSSRNAQFASRVGGSVAKRSVDETSALGSPLNDSANDAGSSNSNANQTTNNRIADFATTAGESSLANLAKRSKTSKNRGLHDEQAHNTSNATLPLNATVGGSGAPATDAQNDYIAFQATNRIPVFDEYGLQIQPGEESARALREERRAEQAAGAEPPSFTPAAQQTGKSEEFSDSPALSHKTTKIIAVVLVALLLIAALGFALIGLINRGGGQGAGQSNSQSNPWPKIDLNTVPFKGNKNEEGGDTAPKQKTTKKAPKPKAAPQPENTTAYQIASQAFIDNTDGQQGYGYHIHLNQAEPVSRFVVTIRSSGGNAQLMANTDKPTSGQNVAQFSFDQSGTTEVKLKDKVTTQDLLLWVPMNSLPGNSLYIEKVQVF